MKRGERMWKKGVFILSIGLLIFGFSIGWGQENKIRIGISCARTGPAAKLGKAYLTGWTAYFKKVNSEGGINGKKIEWIVLDDAYVASKAVENTKRLLDQGVDILAGYVGTPTTRAVLNWIEQNNVHVPFFFPLTGATILKKTIFANTYSIRPFYKDEIQLMVDYFVSRGYTKFGVFYQNDTFGYSGRDALRDVLGKYDLIPVYEGYYEKKTLEMNKAIEDVVRIMPEVVILVGTAPPALKFMEEVFSKIGRNAPIFVCLSFVSADELAEWKNIDKLKIFASQIVPSPKTELDLPIVQEFRFAMKKFYPNAPLSFVSLEGFLGAKLLCEIIKKAESVSPSALRRTAERIEGYDIGIGSVLRYNSLNHRVKLPVSLYRWTPSGWKMVVRRRFNLEMPKEKENVKVDVFIDSVVSKEKGK